MNAQTLLLAASSRSRDTLSLALSPGSIIHLLLSAGYNGTPSSYWINPSQARLVRKANSTVSKMSVASTGAEEWVSAGPGRAIPDIC